MDAEIAGTTKTSAGRHRRQLRPRSATAPPPPPPPPEGLTSVVSTLVLVVLGIALRVLPPLAYGDLATAVSSSTAVTPASASAPALAEAVWLAQRSLPPWSTGVGLGFPAALPTVLAAAGIAPQTAPVLVSVAADGAALVALALLAQGTVGSTTLGALLWSINPLAVLSAWGGGVRGMTGAIVLGGLATGLGGANGGRSTARAAAAALFVFALGEVDREAGPLFAPAVAAAAAFGLEETKEDKAEVASAPEPSTCADDQGSDQPPVPTIGASFVALGRDLRSAARPGPVAPAAAAALAVALGARVARFLLSDICRAAGAALTDAGPLCAWAGTPTLDPRASEPALGVLWYVRSVSPPESRDLARKAPNKERA